MEMVFQRWERLQGALERSRRTGFKRLCKETGFAQMRPGGRILGEVLIKALGDNYPASESEQPPLLPLDTELLDQEGRPICDGEGPWTVARVEQSIREYEEEMEEVGPPAVLRCLQGMAKETPELLQAIARAFEAWERQRG